VQLISKWSNKCVTPPCKRFGVCYQLRPKGQNRRVWRGHYGLDVQKRLPNPTSQGREAPKTAPDSLVFPQTRTPGIYTLSLVVDDPTGYGTNLAFATEGRN
jgi:hypothetical protein